MVKLEEGKVFIQSNWAIFNHSFEFSLEFWGRDAHGLIQSNGNYACAYLTH
jgi:hypothetical protein